MKSVLVCCKTCPTERAMFALKARPGGTIVNRATRLSAMLAAACLTAVVVSGSASAQTALRVGTSSSGSIFYTLAVGLSTLLTKHAGIAATAEPVGGSAANMFAIGADKVDLAISNAYSAYDAYRGVAPFKQKIGVTLFAQGAPSFRQIIVRVGSGIEKPEDLVGRTIIGRRPALPEVGLITEALFKVYKIDPSKVKVVSTTNTGEAVNAIKGDTVDAVVIPGSAGASYLQSLGRDGKIKFLEIPDDKMKEMLALLPKSLALSKLPAKTYPGQDNAVNVFSLPSYMVAASRLSEDTGYKVTKTLFDNIGEFHNFHGVAKQWTLKETLNDPKIPFHPGAVRYFKEKKLWTPEMEKEQAGLKS
ncbi:MAG: TAXI family TRAP transporter solute-binding subunit [Rhizobiales bacterium]|nr:TAXI family TRAP transporter solute-binding subunit [Hyphomicrobiales bacterium]